ncbi:probable C-mannosyltransferase DPY19L3 [Terrapene carolina triunguis]|uniref:probable C-mannosyltransferase DPY19L3 n=1 Tax=Terrapene triunguis TaxID=2587831 RepID=UPI000E77E9DC|nr:probable C-mannosyltransferase DPY19L3 [Terrapene carolina triunguis]
MKVIDIMTTIRHRKGIKVTEVAEDHLSQEKNVKPDGKVRSVYTGEKLWKRLSLTVGGTVAISLGLLTSVYVATLHENDLWFSNIKEVEREISFRTECGLYYSYYKEMLQATSIQQGLHGLIYDNKTESLRTINILERMNVYQEVFLSILYRILPIQKYLEPVYFYIYTLFGLQALYVIALYVTSWLLSGTWLSGLLAAFWYITNRIDTTRVEFTIPLRENWALPFFAVQIAAITYLFRSHLQPLHEKLTLLAVFISTFLFSLTWQFNQFMMLMQALVLFILDCLDMLPTAKVTWLYIIQLTGILLVCVLQFFNSMILGSLLISFNVSVLLARTVQKNMKMGCLLNRLGKLFFHVLMVLCLTLLVNNFIKLCVIRYLVPIITLLYLSYKFCPGMMDELSELREFYDPDTVELMNWIKSNTPKKAVIAGSMQLLAGVKLCTGRILTNHPHYEDKSLRERTKQLYQVYAKRSPEDVYSILRSFGTNYVILEDSICYERRHSRGCRLRDLLDIANGHVMDGLGENEPDLKASLYPRFCTCYPYLFLVKSRTELTPFAETMKCQKKKNLQEQKVRRKYNRSKTLTSWKERRYN